MPQIAETDEQIQNCFDVMAQLRPHLIRNEFVPLVRHLQSHGYEMAFIQQGGDIVAVAGYRIVTNLHMGRHLYVEDLVTSREVRSRGYGKELLDWLRNKAELNGCSYLDLDSGTQRGPAHKFYFGQGFTIASYHFSEKLDDTGMPGT